MAIEISGTQQTRNALALNKAIISTLNTLVLNMPPTLRVDDKAQIMKWKAFTAGNFAPATTIPGMFCYTEDSTNPAFPAACKPPPRSDSDGSG